MTPIRFYKKRELARLYFPGLGDRAAVNKLTRWIKRCGPLYRQLIAIGYHPNKQEYSPREVALIFHHLEEP